MAGGREMVSVEVVRDMKYYSVLLSLIIRIAVRPVKESGADKSSAGQYLEGEETPPPLGSGTY